VAVPNLNFGDAAVVAFEVVVVEVEPIVVFDGLTISCEAGLQDWVSEPNRVAVELVSEFMSIWTVRVKNSNVLNTDQPTIRVMLWTVTGATATIDLRTD
jgi:hypothetical protein